MSGETCLRAAGDKLYQMGIRGKVSRNTVAHANEVRDWRIYQDFAQVLIQIRKGESSTLGNHIDRFVRSR